jgi:putative hemolysin
METQVQRPSSSPFVTPLTPDLSEGRVLGRIGSLEVRLAGTRAEIEAAQSLRYQVFVEEMGARLTAEAMLKKRDFDSVDRYCDHLLVLDTELGGDACGQIVGTYRLLRQDVAERHDGFYSQNEFDVSDMIGRHRNKRFPRTGSILCVAGVPYPAHSGGAVARATGHMRFSMEST